MSIYASAGLRPQLGIISFIKSHKYLKITPFALPWINRAGRALKRRHCERSEAIQKFFIFKKLTERLP
jgi:hypothetical protein